MCAAPSMRCSELREVLRPDEVILPNGMCWDEARGRIYFVDSGAETITAYPTDEQVPQLGGGALCVWGGGGGGGGHEPLPACPLVSLNPPPS